MHQSLKLTNNWWNEITVLGSESCQLKVLAVGGGGDGLLKGGGSGYLQYWTVALDQVVNTISARVGARNQASTININGVTNLTAMNGQDGGNSGGDGYSGGGGCLSCDGGSDDGGSNGGSDGGDGEGSDGGSGSKQNIRDYTFTSWTLTPGAGGKSFFGGGYYKGGGGGGVMVDGRGASGASQYQGEGYGGGGSGGGAFTDGLQGVILLEVESK